MIIESENSLVASTHLYGYIIVFRASNLGNLGLMKAYLESLSKFLYTELKPFESLISDKQEESV